MKKRIIFGICQLADPGGQISLILKTKSFAIRIRALLSFDRKRI